MKVHVKYFAIIREITGVREEAVEAGGSTTVMDLLKSLAEKHGEKFKEYIFDTETGYPRPFLQFMVDGKSISMLQGLSTRFTDDSTFVIVPPVGGG